MLLLNFVLFVWWIPVMIKWSIAGISNTIHVWSEVFLMLMLIAKPHWSLHLSSDHSIFAVLTYICRKVHTCYRNLKVNKSFIQWFFFLFITLPLNFLPVVKSKSRLGSREHGSMFSICSGRQRYWYGVVAAVLVVHTRK